MTARHPRWRAALYVIVVMCVGALVLGCIGAIINAALLASSANHAATSSRNEVTALRHQLKAEQDASSARSQVAKQERAELLGQNRALRKQIKALVAYLQSNGIQVPQTAPSALTQGSGTSGAGKVVVREKTITKSLKPATSGSSGSSGGSSSKGSGGSASSPSTPQPAPTPAPSTPAPPTRTPLACVLGICLTP